MRHLIEIIVLLFVLGVPVSSFSSEDSFKYFYLNAGPWIIKDGNASFQISSSTGGIGTRYLKLEWEGLNSYAYMVGTKLKPYFYFLTLDLQYAGGDLSKGECTDTDWVGGYSPFYISKSDTDGDLKYWSIDLDILLYPYSGKPESWGRGEKKLAYRNRFEVTVGYFHYEYDLNMTKGVQTVDTISNYTGPFSGLNSTYNFEWKGYKTGLRYVLDFIKTPSDRLHAIGFKIKYSHLWKIDFNGEGYWNLSDYRFKDEADDGTGNEWILSFFYNPLKNLQVQFGHRWLTVSAKDGLGDIEAAQPAYLDEVDSSSEGWFFNLAYNF